MDVSYKNKSPSALPIELVQACNTKELFEDLSGIAYFVKNETFDLVAANKEFWSRLNLDSESELIGLNDFELFPSHLAEVFRRDDETVLTTGKPLTNILELFFDTHGLPDWFLTNKYPIHNAAGKAIGINGTVRAYHRHQQHLLSSQVQLEHALQHLREHYTEPIHVPTLARQCGLSVRQFNRKFRAFFHTTPQTFLIKTRIQAAQKLLRESDTPIGTLAQDLGFYDQSSFTLQFRRHVGTTPLRYRKNSSHPDAV